MPSWSRNVFFHLGVFLISVKRLTTEITENKTTPKICKITVNIMSYGTEEGGKGILHHAAVVPIF